MKRFISLLIPTLFLLGLAACGSGDEPMSTPTPVPMEEGGLTSLSSPTEPAS